MSKKTIWEYLKAKGFSDVAAAAIMGNMEAESNCVSCRLQGDFSTDFQKQPDNLSRKCVFRQFHLKLQAVNTVEGNL